MIKIKDKKILMVIAPTNFRDEEFFQPRKILTAAGAVITVAAKGVRQAKGMLGAEVKVDIELIDTNIEDYQAVIFVGGAGTVLYFTEPLALNLAQEAVKKK